MANSKQNPGKLTPGKNTKATAGKSAPSQAEKAAGKSVKRPQPAKSTIESKNQAYEQKVMNKNQNHREILGIIFFLLSFFFFLCWFNTEKVLLGPLAKVSGGLFGQIGRYTMPIMLFYGAIILFTSRGAPVRMRIWCSFFTVIFLSSFVHVIIDFLGDLNNDLHIRMLWKNGQNWKSGGVIPGLIAELLEAGVTRFGAFVITLVAMVLFALATQNITLTGILTAMKKRQAEPLPPPKETPSERFVNRVASGHRPLQERKSRDSRRDNYDLPLDDPPYYRKDEKLGKTSTEFIDTTVEETEEIPVPKVNKEIVFEQQTKAKPKRERVVYDQDLDIDAPPATIHVPQMDDAPVPKKEDTAPAKISKKEAAQAAASISREIAESAPVETAYVFPGIELLNHGKNSSADGTAEMRENAKRLADTLQSFNVTPHIVEVIRGPSVTRYELELDPGVKLSKITGLADDIALNLGAQGVRISAIPDKISVVGIEVPNKSVNTVYAKEVIGSSQFAEKKSRVSFAVGKDISGTCIVGDIGKMPHMLIAGTTGSGKSVCMNTLIVSLLYKAKPEEVKLIMVDPKMVELSVYNGIPHLLIPVVTDPKKAAGALQWTVTEMLRRYRLMSDRHVRDIESYNKSLQDDPTVEKLPQIVVVIDELADLMLVAAKEVEESICRIAQMGRASGIHLVIATQRPSADVITGTMKANIPSRIAFSVSSAMESRIILDMQGAEKLVGRGDMLFAPHGQGKPQRVQGCFITDDEVSRVVEFIKNNTTTNYSEEIDKQIDRIAEQGSTKQNHEPAPVSDEASDEMLPAAVEVILETGQASVSMLQRRLKLGYARAARIVDEMEEKGIVGPFEGAKPRQLLITRDQWEQMKDSFGEGTAEIE